jgi:hypothetical protein
VKANGSVKNMAQSIVVNGANLICATKPNSSHPEHMQAMNVYKTTKVVIYSSSGTLLLASQFIYNPHGELP